MVAVWMVVGMWSKAQAHVEDVSGLKVALWVLHDFVV